LEKATNSWMPEVLFIKVSCSGISSRYPAKPCPFKDVVKGTYREAENCLQFP